MDGNLEYFLDYKREIELAEIDTMEGDQEVIVMKQESGFGEGVCSEIVVAVGAPLVAILKANA
jgi:hypothetical protein